MAAADPILTALVNLESRLFDRVREEMGRQLDGLRLELNGRFDAIEIQLRSLDEEYHMIVAGLRRIEEQIQEGQDDRARLRAAVSGLKSRVVDLESRIREIEARLGDE
jgi:chromosome segregation ATPase